MHVHTHTHTDTKSNVPFLSKGLTVEAFLLTSDAEGFTNSGGVVLGIFAAGCGCAVFEEEGAF